MKICPHCHKRYDDAVKFCPHDGTVMPDPVDEFLGQRLMGQFDIQRRCGEGAMGTVYQAHQINMDRLVAIKILRQDLVRDRTVVKRFYREAKAAARLSHPNIITVHLVAETDQGLPYIVMEYLEGTDLDALCKDEAPVVIRRGINIAMQIASALAEAHHHDVIHRDLKPANIIVFEKHDRPDFIKVLDFGIAKILEGGTSDESRITKSGAIFGTPYYLSPEQATGGELDARADLYSLGVILYRLVTGHLPFESGSGLDILVRHVKEPPPPPRLHNPSISGSLEGVILQALDKDRDKRFASAEEMRAALGAVLGETAAVEAGSSDPSTGWAVPDEAAGEGKSKRTVFGFSSGAGSSDVVGPVSPEEDPLARATKKAIAFSRTVPASKGVAAPVGLPQAPTSATPSAKGSAPAPVGSPGEIPRTGAWGIPSEAEPATDDIPGSRQYHAAAAAPPPVKAPRFDPDADHSAAAPPSTSEPVATATVPLPPDSSPSVVTGQHAAPLSGSLTTWRRVQDRGRWITIGTTILAIIALGVGIYFVIHDRQENRSRGVAQSRRSSVGAPDAGIATAMGRFVSPDASIRRTSPPVAPGTALVKLVKQGFGLRMSCESRLRPGRDLSLVLDLWKDGSGQPVSGARIQLTLSGKGVRRAKLEAVAAKVPGRYVFHVRFGRPGTKRAKIRVITGDSVEVSTAFDVTVRSEHPSRHAPMQSGMRIRKPMRSSMRNSMDRPMDVLPRLPPDRPMGRPMGTLPRPPADPPAPPADPD